MATRTISSSNNIALISSTLKPQAYSSDGSVILSCYSYQERLDSTLSTIDSLYGLGFKSIYLADNSSPPLPSETFRCLGRRLTFLRYPMAYQYSNKGISEAQLLLCALQSLPDNTRIHKISGRYQLSALPVSLDTPSDFDLACKVSKKAVPYFMSTRYYVSRDKRILRYLLTSVLREIFAYPSRIVGPRSFMHFMTNIVIPGRNTYPYESPHISLESAFYNVIARSSLMVQPLHCLNVSGSIGNSFSGEVAYD